MAPIRIHTRSNPDHNPPHIIDNPELTLRRKIPTESQGSNNPPSKDQSLHVGFENLDEVDIRLDLDCLFRTKSDTWIPQTVFDENGKRRND